MAHSTVWALECSWCFSLQVTICHGSAAVVIITCSWFMRFVTIAAMLGAGFVVDSFCTLRLASVALATKVAEILLCCLELETWFGTLPKLPTLAKRASRRRVARATRQARDASQIRLSSIETIALLMPASAVAAFSFGFGVHQRMIGKTGQRCFDLPESVAVPVQTRREQMPFSAKFAVNSPGVRFCRSLPLVSSPTVDANELGVDAVGKIRVFDLVEVAKVVVALVDCVVGVAIVSIFARKTSLPILAVRKRMPPLADLAKNLPVVMSEVGAVEMPPSAQLAHLFCDEQVV